jgi:uncharacterized protein (TIGR02246 family)
MNMRFVKAGLLAFGSVSMFGLAFSVAAQDAKPVAEAKKAEEPAAAAIRETLKAFTTAYNSAKVENVAALFADDATIIDSDGGEIKGRDAIVAMYTTAFADAPNLKIDSEATEIKLVTDDVARVEGKTRLYEGNADGVEFTKFSALMVRKAGNWKTVELRDYPTPHADILPADRLKELEWMLGDWVDESDSNRVSSSVKWNEGKSFLIRTYHVEIAGIRANSGTVIIGWSPQAGQIKSWMFDSEGGIGEGLWTKTDANKWVVKAQGVLRDGRPTSATQIHELLNRNAVKTSSIDRIIGGEVANDIRDILMVRKPAEPATIPSSNKK